MEATLSRKNFYCTISEEKREICVISNRKRKMSDQRFVVKMIRERLWYSSDPEKTQQLEDVEGPEENSCDRFRIREEASVKEIREELTRIVSAL